MKRFLVFANVLFCLVSTVNAQRFQVTTGTRASGEEKWAVVEDPAINGYVAIGNAFTSANFGRLWISSYNATGVISTSAIATNGREMIARDICIAPPSGGQPTYYVTGWTVLPGSPSTNQMFVGRILLNGTFIWYTESPGTAPNNSEEGVAIVAAPNGDAVAAGNVAWPVTGPVAAGIRVRLARFTAAGAVVWSNEYNQNGNWMVREIANAVPAPGCAPSPATQPGEFVITGEWTQGTGSAAGPCFAFAAVYNGGGVECWRNLYPTGISGSTGDAGYDVMYNPASGNYTIAGAAQFGPGRTGTATTPYVFEVTKAGASAGGVVYFSPGMNPMGLYPRTITRGPSTAPIVIAGPDFMNNRTFFAKLPGIGPTGLFYNYLGNATANSYAQPFFLDDAQPECIVPTNLLGKPGYIISTNISNGTLGVFDGHFIRTDLAGRTPDKCPPVQLPNIPQTTTGSISFTSTPFAIALWASATPSNFNYPVVQDSCRDTCIVAASYTYSTSFGTVSFSGVGSGNGTLSYLWTFGDGGTSTLVNPVHTYGASGTYTACLTVINVNSAGDTCTAVVCKPISVTVCNVVANFTYTVACKYKVTFTNTTTGPGPLTYNWLFDDGTTSTAVNPVKTFTACGPHVTRLVACNTTCCDTILITVNIPCCAVTSDFCLQDSGGSVRLLYNPAMNLPTTTYTVYVDGVVMSWSANALKTLSAGLHTVCLKARRVSCPGDTCCSVCCKTIRVHAQCKLVADFWHQEQTTGNVVFTNKTTPSGYNSTWDFGDGSPFVSTASPAHIYTTPGTYTACLVATIITGSDTCIGKICKTIVIDQPCKPLASFKTKFCIATPLTVDFINYSVGGGSSSWDFGDGSASVVSSPSHIYSVAGTYVVCLTETVTPMCWSRSCYAVTVSTATCTSSCTALPSTPTYRMRSNDVIQPWEMLNPMELVAAESRENGKFKDAKALQQEKMKKTLNNDKLYLFPNPASQKVHVIFETSKATAGEINVMNALGNVMYKKTVYLIEGKNQFDIPLLNFGSGNYFLRLNTAEKAQAAMFTVRINS